MPDVSVGSQIFDLIFHPSHSTVYTGLLSGKVKAYSYDQEGNSKQTFSVKVSQKSCRGIAISEDGERLHAVGKGKGLHTIDTATGKLVESRARAHEVAINRVKNVTSWLLSTGDDDGVIKLWDPRKKDAVRKYTHHFDYITDFLWLEDKKQLVATSGDGTLSVIDVRSKSPDPFAQSEDQEDELLSIVPIKGATKIIVGTQLGILSVFNRSSGWGDCVDRIPGHPHSVDALCALPSTLPNVDHTSTILTGSSDGFVRAVSVFPTKLHGIVADHGEWPVERIAVGEGMSQLSLGGDDDDDDTTSRSARATKVRSPIEADDEAAEGDSDSEALPGHYWAGSAGHDEVLKLTNLTAFFNGKDTELGIEECEEKDDDVDDGLNAGEQGAEEQRDQALVTSASDVAKEASDVDFNADSDSDIEPEASRPKKRKKKENDPLSSKRKKGRNEVEVEGAFFNDL